MVGCGFRDYLHDSFGMRWVDFGVVVLKNKLQSTLPPPLVKLVNIVATVENMSKGLMTSYEKQQRAVQMARAS
jgi:hypothetical protein